ncbi:MAG: cation diffusion facilitator family transporter [Bacteroidota bacterium]|nr:cation diffusion facilitator family transporter [Bacteroidota bacterium]
MTPKTSAASISIMSNCSLIIMKFIAGILSGSVSIISEAIHSLMDLLAALIAFFAVRISDNPADEEHPYGHGKFENVSGVIEAMLIFIAAVWIIYKAILKLFNGEPLDNTGIGIIVMSVSAISNFFVSRHLYRVAKKTESIALEADALHLKTDVYTSAGVAVGLILIYLTGIRIIDPIAAILVAMLILKESYDLLNRAYKPLLDTAISSRELKIVEKCIRESNYAFHDLKSRQSGKQRFIEFHLEMPGDVPLKEVHQKCDEIEELIKSRISDISINIHVETKDA